MDSSDSRTSSETTPLVPPSASKKPKIPLPKLQIGIILILQLAEPIASASIFPYINQLIKGLDITGGDDAAVGYYAGIIESLFFFTQALTVLRWSRLSDRIGRKPVFVSSDAEREALAQKSMANMPLRSLLVPTTVIPIVNYSILAFLDISLKALFPLFFSTPIYLGGLGLTPSAIGSWMALSGIVDGLFQALFFAKIVSWLGPKRLFCVSVPCFAPVMLMFPIMSQLAQARGVIDHAITSSLLSQLVLIIIWDMAFATAFMFITGSALAKNVLGAINGLGQTSAALARAFGPALATSLFAFSKEHNVLNICHLHHICLWIAIAGIAIATRNTRY
ncbi:hypothetical protein K503DRAFT_798763 [Rhizopogon vinicolor AM-OR11-026]|uniref:MFS general substrate transporter n=1 Tax=Rhizopogon vinicolor AM-OR11-026 TaxID=1314800 RepID=A0A1B7N6Q0_9AGAM|nr:hypothetical protein K503DRAFT_798763 [Rhizopogon vinicolor AM-OR11-026]